MFKHCYEDNQSQTKGENNLSLTYLMMRKKKKKKNQCLCFVDVLYSLFIS